MTFPRTPEFRGLLGVVETDLTARMMSKRAARDGKKYKIINQCIVPIE